jgi:hypothetical protein
MRKGLIVCIIIIIAGCISAGPVFAEETTTVEETVEPEVTTAPEESEEEESVITPDSILYPVKRLIESVQLFFTFGNDNKCELLITFANERIREAQIMTEENQQKLISRVMNSYVRIVEKINKRAERNAERDGENPETAAVLESVVKVSENAQQLVFKATGILPEEEVDLLKSKIEDQVKRTLALQSISLIKDIVKDANQNIREAREAVEEATEEGDEEKVAEAKLALEEAIKAREEIQVTKEEVKEFAQLIRNECKTKEGERIKIRKELKDAMKKYKIKSADSDSGEEKRKQIIEKLKGLCDKTRKAAEKQSENLEKHINKRWEQINKIMSRFADEGQDEAEDSDEDTSNNEAGKQNNVVGGQKGRNNRGNYNVRKFK